MNTIQSIVLGLVQGLTEFLPVSSSAHLILTPYVFSWEDPGLAFDVALHMGTLAAILLYFRREWVALFFQLIGKKPSATLAPAPRWYWIVLGTVPAALAGLALEKQAEEAFRSPLLIAVTLILFGLLLGFADTKGRKKNGITAVGWKEALVIGCAQALAIVPGVSRSGVTITAALLLGLNRMASMRFSFLLSAPIIAGAGILKLKHLVALVASSPEIARAVAVGFVSSLVSGMFALVLLNALAKTKTLMPFVYYRLALGLIVIIIVVIH